ncbi:MAG: acetylglutamate kinase [Candidatus Cryptobacteroides sp.]|nr:acetylglutamate kinase [Candidatus Cryptobacteroides sp.]
MIRVVKIGGNVVDNPALLKSFVADFARLEGPRVLVHGGGVLASQMQKELGMTPTMIQGRRVTDEQTLRIVTMVYAGWCNKNITALLQAEGCNACGLSGADADAIRAVRRAPLDIDGQKVDFGMVGDVSSQGVNTELMKLLLGNGIVPVLCAINHDGHGNLLNTNADTIASSVATALGPDSELVFCFEKEGVLKDVDDPSSVIPHMTESEFALLKEQGVIAGGMIPKLQNAFKAIRSGVRRVCIKHPSSLLGSGGTVLE